MTIITKPLSEKKEGKLILPLVENQQATAPPGDDVEAQAQDPTFIILRTRARRVSTTTTLCLLFTALIVVGVGILGGSYLYRQYLRSQVFIGRCSIPYGQGEAALLVQNNVDEYDEQNKLNEVMNKLENMFDEEFELDIQNEEYEKINVPDFKDGRNGRFVHDFNTNKTGIIDITGKRCFVLPLDRDKVLPPKSLVDLIHKMWEGYYKVDTEVIRETMKVITPATTDMKEIGEYISRECVGLPIYKLEKFVGGVWKRSADPHHDLTFAQFSGKGIIEFNIVNIDELQEEEKKP